MFRVALFCVMILSCCTGRVQAQQAPPAETPLRDRHQFARQLAKVTEGMPEKEILDLLGKPDDIRTHIDPGGIRTTHTREIWRYGTSGHLSFPTLGSVYIDDKGRAQHVDGGRDEPPDTKLFTEKELQQLLRLIDRVPSYNYGYRFNPLPIIQIVNTLQPLGKEKALAVIEEYLRVSSRWEYEGREGVFLVLRVLFDVPADPGYMPVMHVGAPYPREPEDPKQLPRFPILLVDDVPLLVVSGYMLGGFPEQPESHLEYFREHGQIRKKPLVPSSRLHELLAAWEKQSRGLRERYNDHDKVMIANQLLRLVDTVYRPKPDSKEYTFWPKSDEADEWQKHADQVEKLKIRWDAAKIKFTLADGTILPEPVRPLYRRQIWNVEGLNGKAELILERQSPETIRACLQWSGKRGALPKFELMMYHPRDKTDALPLGNATSVGGTIDEDEDYTEAFNVDLPEGSEVLMRLKIGDHEQWSPTFKP